MRLPGLRRQCDLRCWTITDVARASGVTRATAAQAVYGQNVSIRTAQKILAALDTAPPKPVAFELLDDSREFAPVERRSA